MLTKNGFTTITLGICLVLVGCSTPPAKPETRAEPDPIALALADSAKSIAESYRHLASIKQARLKPSEIDRQLQYKLSELPDAWSKPVTLIETFDGSALEFITTISALAGMEPPRQLRYDPARPSLVHINSGTRPLMDFIAEAGYQVKDSMELRVSEKLNRITIKHKEL